MTNIFAHTSNSDTNNKTALRSKSSAAAPLPSSASARAYAAESIAASKAKPTRNAAIPTEADIALAQSNFAQLFAKTVKLYTLGETASVSKREAAQLANSLAYVLGIHNLSPEDTVCALAVPNIEALYEQQLAALETRISATLELWQKVCITMPPLNNVSLRDTLASIGNLRSLYDMRFAAHEVPCSIDYQLSIPVSDNLQGIDYLQAWLQQALVEATYLAQFNTQDCISLLERICPDYRGLHVNLYDLVKPHEHELRKNGLKRK